MNHDGKKQEQEMDEELVKDELQNDQSKPRNINDYDLYDKKKGDKKVVPLFGIKIPTIHPMIGVDYSMNHSRAYVGVWTDAQIYPKDKEGNTINDPELKPYLNLIFEDGLNRPADNTFLAAHNCRLSTDPIYFQSRWDIFDVKDFIEYPCKNIPSLSDLYQRIKKQFHIHMEYQDEREYAYQPIWVMHTHFAHLFNCSPYGYYGGIKRVGKTKNLMLLSMMCHNAIFSNNMSPSALFRLNEAVRPTLLLDETELLHKKNNDRLYEIRSLLLAGYKKGARVHRVEKIGNSFVVKDFDPYGPKALANISGLDDVLEDRVAHTTIIRRSLTEEILNREVDVSEHSSEHTEFQEIRNMAYRVYLAHWRKVEQKYGELGEPNALVNLFSGVYPDVDVKSISGRQWELWRPIITLAMLIEESTQVLFTSSSTTPYTLVKEMLELAITSKQALETENVTETTEAVLVNILVNIVTKDTFYSVKDLTNAVRDAFEGEKEWLTSRYIGRLLRKLGFTEKRRMGRGYQYRLIPEDVQTVAKGMGIGKIQVPMEDDKDEKTQSERLQLFEKTVPPELMHVDILKRKLQDEGYPLDYFETDRDHELTIGKIIEPIKDFYARNQGG